MSAEFVQSFQPGDKVYGLAGSGLGRDKYICTNEFVAAFGSLDVTTDQLNNRFLGTGTTPDGPSIYYSNLMYGVQPANTTAAQAEETDKFRIFLETHPKEKYRPSAHSSKVERNVRVARACKAALEFNVILMNRRIHFVLDDIDLQDVMAKNLTKFGNKSITGQELRFIYRNSVMMDFGTDEFQKQLRIRTRNQPITTHSGQSQRKPAPIFPILHPWTVASTAAVGKTNRILSNVKFWWGGKLASPPWNDGLIRDLWYGLYGEGYDQDNFMTKKLLNESVSVLSRESFREARVNAVVYANKERLQKRLEELRSRPTPQGQASSSDASMDCN